MPCKSILWSVGKCLQNADKSVLLVVCRSGRHRSVAIAELIKATTEAATLTRWKYERCDHDELMFRNCVSHEFTSRGMPATDGFVAAWGDSTVQVVLARGPADVNCSIRICLSRCFFCCLRLVARMRSMTFLWCIGIRRGRCWWKAWRHFQFMISCLTFATRLLVYLTSCNYAMPSTLLQDVEVAR